MLRSSHRSGLVPGKNWRFLTASVFFIFISCSTRVPVKGIEAYYRYDYKTAIDTFRKSSSVQDKDTALYNLALLSAAMDAGDYWDAERAALQAQQIMWSYEGAGRGVSSLVSAEALKIFKGEPFEKSMAAIYLVIIFYNRGEYDNARAAFQKALLAIKQKEPPHQEDFALPFLLLSKALLKNGDTENAKIAYDKGQKALGSSKLFSFESLASSNSLFVFELGQGPIKVRTGPGQSLIDWARRKYPERHVSLVVDGKDWGRAADVGDLTEQARTKGTTAKDAIQATKGVLREASGITAVIAANEAAKRNNKTAGWVALGAGLFALANQSQADLRQWELLPDRIQMLPVNLFEGNMTFHLRFEDSTGRAIPSYEQIWYEIPIKKEKDRIFLFRSGAYKKES